MDSVLVIGAGDLGLCVVQALAAHAKRQDVRASVPVRQAAPAKKRTVENIRRPGVQFEPAE
ncbi:NmrA family protein [Metarhizium album ARSEF 1941]|uniref:NmrA family protein n=1 Tax=Metarhizium album (strain ARSEF 1941) TaxID=1081103 RepID=A0A0B2X0A9_METAS|nr:NmrA family protein [Metarhizium album ARSEF 1941]KHN99728.1 NmrA family protein [Metarhizium album ARSEF 1941]